MLGWFILSPIIIYSLFSAISDGVRIYDVNGSINPVLYFYFFGMETQQIKEHGLHVFLWNYVDNVYAAIPKAIIMGTFITIIVFYVDKLRNRVLININIILDFFISLFTDFFILILMGIIIEYGTIYLVKERFDNYDIDYSNLWFSLLCWGFIGFFIRISNVSDILSRITIEPTRNFPKVVVNQIVIKSMSLPKRCEICHQSDMFDASNGGKCYRCLDINLSLFTKAQ